MKTLDIRWQHFDQDGDTCVRCAETGKNLGEALRALAAELQAAGAAVTFEEVRLPASAIAQSHRIFINGRALETLLPGLKTGENYCGSCSEMTQQPTYCRTVEHAGRTYEEIPVSLIREAALQVLQEKAAA